MESHQGILIMIWFVSFIIGQIGLDSEFNGEKDFADYLFLAWFGPIVIIGVLFAYIIEYFIDGKLIW